MINWLLDLIPVWAWVIAAVAAAAGVSAVLVGAALAGEGETVTTE